MILKTGTERFQLRPIYVCLRWRIEEKPRTINLHHHHHHRRKLIALSSLFSHRTHCSHCSHSIHLFFFSLLRISKCIRVFHKKDKKRFPCNPASNPYISHVSNSYQDYFWNKWFFLLHSAATPQTYRQIWKDGRSTKTRNGMIMKNCMIFLFLLKIRES